MSKEREECIYKKDFGKYRIEARRYKIFGSESYTPTHYAMFNENDMIITALSEDQIKMFNETYEEVQIMKQDAAYHLKNLLYMLADLHPDHQCVAYKKALEFHNKTCPEEQIKPSDIAGVSTKIVHTYSR